MISRERTLTKTTDWDSTNLGYWLPPVVVPACVQSLQTHSTKLGQRIYAVFKTADSHKVGIWAPDDHQQFASLTVGKVVFFRREATGHLRLLPQPPSQIELWFWRLKRIFNQLV
jgi:hypothetical protein